MIAKFRKAIRCLIPSSSLDPGSAERNRADFSHAQGHPVGELESVRGASLIVSGFGRAAAIGDRVRVNATTGPVPGEIVRVRWRSCHRDGRGARGGLTPGAQVVLVESSGSLPVRVWLGRVVDGSGRRSILKGRCRRGNRR